MSSQRKSSLRARTIFAFPSTEPNEPARSLGRRLRAGSLSRMYERPCAPLHPGASGFCCRSRNHHKGSKIASFLLTMEGHNTHAHCRHNFRNSYRTMDSRKYLILPSISGPVIFCGVRTKQDKLRRGSAVQRMSRPSRPTATGANVAPGFLGES